MFTTRSFGRIVRLVIVGGILVFLLSNTWLGTARQATAQSPDLKPKEEPTVAQDFPKPGDIPESMMHRRNLAAAQALLEQLRIMPELEFLDGNPQNSADLAKELNDRTLSHQSPRSRPTTGNGSNSIQQDETIPLFSDYQRRRWVNLGLTALQEPHCQISPTEARSLESTANQVRRAGMISMPGPKGKIIPPRMTSSWKVSSSQRQVSSTFGPHGPVDMVPAFVQMLQAEEEPSRDLLIDWLAKNETLISSTALAQRAIFDLSPRVREAAITALKTRPRIIYRSVLLAGLRHPWAPVANHAAEALVALEDREAVPELKTLVDEPNPSGAFRLPGISDRTFVRELVRVNHLRNCFLCHAPSFDERDLVRGLVPTPGKALSFQYYATRPSKGDIFVRADITYLRQDFSVVHPVAKAAPWPESQRYDYLVRTRVATTEEEVALEKPPATYPQREAVLFALKELSK